VLQDIGRPRTGMFRGWRRCACAVCTATCVDATATQRRDGYILKQREQAEGDVTLSEQRLRQLADLRARRASAR